MKGRKCLVLLILCALVCIGMPAFAGSEKEEVKGESAKVEKKPVIASVPQSSFAGETSLAYYKGIQDTVEKLGYELLVRDPNFDGAKQVEIMEDIIAQKDSANIQGILLQAIDSTLIVSAVEKANAAGIPVCGVIAVPDGGEVFISVASDLHHVGEVAAQAMVDELVLKYGEPRGLVISIGGPLTCMVSNGRGEGMVDTMAKYPDIEVIHRACDWQIPKAEQAVRDLLTAYPDADGILSYTDYYSDGIESALSSLGKLHKTGDPNHIIWTSVDGMPSGLERIRREVKDATANSPCEIYGVLAMQYLHEYLTTGKKPVIGEVVEKEGEPWSPGKIVQGPSGPVLMLPSYRIDEVTVDEPFLWGNKRYAVREGRVVYE